MYSRAQVRAPTLLALVIGGFRPALVDAELSALFPDPIHSILPTVELRYDGVTAIPTADFDRKGAVVGFKDFVLRFAHPRNMRPESVSFHPSSAWPRSAGTMRPANSGLTSGFLESWRGI